MFYSRVRLFLAMQKVCLFSLSSNDSCTEHANFKKTCTFSVKQKVLEYTEN